MKDNEGYIWDYFEVFIRLSREENEENCDNAHVRIAHNAHVRIAHKLTEILTETILKAFTFC